MIDNKDLRIETHTNASKFVTMSIVHIPSGILEKDIGISQYLLKIALIRRIEEKLKNWEP